MKFAVLQDYQKEFAVCAAVIRTFTEHYDKKLWNELTIAVMQFIYHPQVKGRITFQFYNDFVRFFQKNIDQINLLKIVKECIVKLSKKEALEFLIKFEEKEAFTQETKVILQAFQGCYHFDDDLRLCSQILHKIKDFVDKRKDFDSLVYSSYYRLSMGFYAAKRKYKNFYSSALQFLAYTPIVQIDEQQQLNLLFQMAVAVIVSDEIYNFSELLEQPLLASLKQSSYAWIYELLEIFNSGDISKFNSIILQHEELKANSKKLQQKIRLMAFLEMAFKLPKNNRVISFQAVARACDVNVDQIEFLVMKAMALKLVRGSIDQLSEKVTITWVAPKVLQSQRIGVMLNKFEQWSNGINHIYNAIKEIKPSQ